MIPWDFLIKSLTASVATQYEQRAWEDRLRALDASVEAGTWQKGCIDGECHEVIDTRIPIKTAEPGE